MKLTGGTVHVFTYKEGLLSPVGHDLQLHVDTFQVSVEGDWINARFDPRTLQVDGAMKNGRLDTEVLNAIERADIEQAATTEILPWDRYGEIHYRAPRPRGDELSFRLDGELTLHGQTHPLPVDVPGDADAYRGEVEFAPSRWGVKPYRALLGALKVQDRVTVRFEIR